MAKLTIGKMRGLQEIAHPDGLIAILAIDHRGPSLALPLDDLHDYPATRDFKLAVLTSLQQHASSVLLDPVYSAAEAVARGVLPPSKHFLIAVEATDHKHQPSSRLSYVLPGWSLEKTRRMGASAAKLYFEYHPHAGEETARQEQFVAGLIAEARCLDLLLLVEPITYSLDPAVPKNSAAFAAQRPDLVIESVRRIGALGPDILKVEFPFDADFDDDESAWADACAAIGAASPVPWVLLSAGIAFETFGRQLTAACRGGASGHATGRTIWKEAVAMPPAGRDAFLRTTAADRAAALDAIVREHGTPWMACYPDLKSAGGEGWMAAY